MYRHVFAFERQMATETAELFVPSHVEGFVQGQSYVGSDGVPRYSFDTSAKMAAWVIKDIEGIS